MEDHKTPGVYIAEKSTFPSSVVGVPTAVPVFIGYTEKAIHNGKALNYIPTKITSIAAYTELFGGAFKAKFVVSNTAKPSEATVQLNGQNILLQFKTNHELYFYNCIRLFYLNGGNECYILSVGNYTDATTNGVSANDFFGSDEHRNVFKILEKEWEPTLIVLPDAAAEKPTTGEPGAYAFYQQVLQHCAIVQSRMGIFDVARAVTGSDEDAIALFRTKMVSNALNYGAAYYPWLQTTVVNESEVDLDNLDTALAMLQKLIPQTETAAIKILDAMAIATVPQPAILQLHQSLLATSATYKELMAALRSKLNLMPPASAIAGIYTAVDSARAVWKAPANVAVSGVNAPEVNILPAQQELMNIDPLSGKSINSIRSFPGIGTLVWGARTLDGNSQDWRYINVRRTMIFIEQSLKLAVRNFIFDPNYSGTWITVESMINNFLFYLWKQGALAGDKPEAAFSVQVGLGITMTPDDILEGILRVTVLVAISRPAEFIEITFQQQQQKA